MAGIFKAYDIRGIYGEELTEDLARAIGRALATFLGCRKVAVGRDIRPHSAPLFAALADGITLQGADVVDLGECSTPILLQALKASKPPCFQKPTSHGRKSPFAASRFAWSPTWQTVATASSDFTKRS